MQFYEYKGYTIYPAPQFSVRSCDWKVELVIKCDHSFKKYGTENGYSSEGEALINAIIYGKKLIDNGTVFIKEAV